MFHKNKNANNSNGKKTLNGFIKRHPDGFGFFIPDSTEEEDVYIPKHSMVGIMTHDRVTVEVVKEPGGNRFRGEITQILTRGVTSIVGTISDLNDKYMILTDQSGTWGADLKVPMEFTKGAKSGTLVHVEITQYPSDGIPFLGKVAELLGNIEDPLNDVKRVLKGLNIPVEFSAATYKEVAPLTHDPEPSEFKNRKDIRDLSLITIDGATAKDFDDAVFTETTPNGFHLIVAIADVSHYVRPNTALDKDAYERGTSVYFPNYVVPMLPEELSNGLCSLKPNVPRLCLVADMQFNFIGEMTSSDFYEAVMQSKARVLYGEAQEIVDGVTIEKLEHVKENILRCADLAKVLMAKRFKEGSLDLELPETQLVIDGSGNPIDVQKSERLFAHRLIEELMLAANVAVSRFLESREIPSMFRIHDEPSADNIMLLEKYLHNLGSRFRTKGGVLQKQLTGAIQEFTKRPEGHIVNILTLRSMAQAKYSSQNIGHFGLGFESYTHFTSPIRRYPDLIVHRLIKSQVCPQRGYPSYEEDTLTTAATMLSSCEQRAVKSERQFMAIKKARFMVQHIDQEFQGLVSSVTKFGIFVLLREYDIDGLVKAEHLGDDKWVFDEDNLSLTGQRSKKVFKIGDILTVKVVAADTTLGQVDFDLPDELKAFGKSGKPFVKEGSRESSRGGGGSRGGDSSRSGRRGGTGHKERGTPNKARDSSDREGSGRGKERSTRRGGIGHDKSRDFDSDKKKSFGEKPWTKKPMKNRGKDESFSKKDKSERPEKSFRAARTEKQSAIAGKKVFSKSQEEKPIVKNINYSKPTAVDLNDEDVIRRRLIEEKLRKLGLDKPSPKSDKFSEKGSRENFKNRKDNRKNPKKRR